MEVMCIFCIVIGIICTALGFVKTIVYFIDPIEHLWTVPLFMIGIIYIYMGCSKYIEIQVDKELNNRIVYENIIVEEGK